VLFKLLYHDCLRIAFSEAAVYTFGTTVIPLVRQRMRLQKVPGAWLEVTGESQTRYALRAGGDARVAERPTAARRTPHGEETMQCSRRTSFGRSSTTSVSLYC
jgi:hypothetical protein